MKQRVESEVNGRVIDIRVEAGSAVAADQVLAVLESMKMEIELSAPSAGKVALVHVATGDVVEEGQTLFEIE
jgi:biotin carboxyl carrier protein